MDEANRRLNELRADMQSVGIAKEDLKTRFFNITTNYERIEKREVFKGYKANHRLELKLPMDKETLNQVLTKISRGASETQMKIGFDVSNKQALQNKSLTQAVQDAKEKAKALTQAAGVKLGELISIQYGWTEVHISSSHQAIIAESVTPYDFDIQPDGVGIEDGATLVWELK